MSLVSDACTKRASRNPPQIRHFATPEAIAQCLCGPYILIGYVFCAELGLFYPPCCTLVKWQIILMELRVILTIDKIPHFDTDKFGVTRHLSSDFTHMADEWR